MSSAQVGVWAEGAKLMQTKSRKQNGRRQCMVIQLWFQCTAHPVILQLFWPVCHTHNPLLLGMRTTSIRSQHLHPSEQNSDCNPVDVVSLDTAQLNSEDQTGINTSRILAHHRNFKVRIMLYSTPYFFSPKPLPQKTNRLYLQPR